MALTLIHDRIDWTLGVEYYHHYCFPLRLLLHLGLSKDLRGLTPCDAYSGYYQHPFSKEPGRRSYDGTDNVNVGHIHETKKNNGAKNVNATWN